MRELKLELVTSICHLILTPTYQEVLVEGLRVIANLCKHKHIVQHLYSLRYYERILISPDHSAFASKRRSFIQCIGVLVEFVKLRGNLNRNSTASALMIS